MSPLERHLLATEKRENDDERLVRILAQDLVYDQSDWAVLGPRTRSSLAMRALSSMNCLLQ